MRDLVIGIAAIAALLWIAYGASDATTSSWRGTAASAATDITVTEAYRPKRIPDAEAVVGRPHDGIRALPTRRVERAR